MFRKISSAAAADALSFSSPFTRPGKPAPLNSRNSTSLLLQMFRKISSSAAADAHSFSSLASPPDGKLSSLFTRPPKPTPLNSRNSRSLLTYAENSHDEPDIGVSTARLQKFLQTNCKSGNVSADEAFRFFHRMVQMEPRFPLYSFNLLLKGLANNKRHYDVLSLFGKMNSVGLTPNFITLNTLLNCLCKENRVCDAFLIMGSILRKGYSPTIRTFNSLIKGLCIGSRVDDAVQLFLTLGKFGCIPKESTWLTLYYGLILCGLGNASNALKFHEETVIGNGQRSVRCKPDIVSYSCIIGCLCKEGKEDKAMELFLEMQRRGITPNTRVYNYLMNGLCYAGKWKDAESLLDEMVDQEIQLDGKTCYVLIDILCQTGSMKELAWFLDCMIKHGIDLKSKVVDISMMIEGRTVRRSRRSDII